MKAHVDVMAANESLAYNWQLGQAMLLGSLQCLGVLLFWVLV